MARAISKKYHALIKRFALRPIRNDRDFAEARKIMTEVLRFIMEENQLSQNQLAKEMEIDQGLVSNFLSGKRSLSKANALKFAERFKVSVELFLDKPMVN